MHDEIKLKYEIEIIIKPSYLLFVNIVLLFKL